MATLPELLQTLVANNGSDLHITTDTPPQIRVHGHLKPLDLPSLCLLYTSDAADE